jgi:hypothetical protein
VGRGDNADKEEPAMFRFSLLTLFGAILVISVGCAALASASDAWAKAVVSATVLALLTSTVGAIYLPGQARAFAGGFAIFGWSYLLLVQGPWLESMKPQLVTTVALNKLQGVMHEDSGAMLGQAVTFTGGGSSFVLNSVTGTVTANNVTVLSPTFVPTIPSSAQFHQIGQSLWAIILACVGGLLARAFGDRVKKPNAG